MADTTKPPSYYDSTSSSHSNLLFSSNTQPVPLHQQVVATRMSHIAAVVHTHLVPRIFAQAERGLSETVIALLPANNTGLGEAHEKSSRQLTLSDNDTNTEVVLLSSSLDTPAFWAQSSVLDGLQNMLAEALSPTNTDEADPLSEHSAEGRGEPQEPLPPRTTRKTRLEGWRSRTSGIKRQQQAPRDRPLETGNHEASEGWLVRRRTRAPIVQVREEDFCFRTKGAFGLYDTVAKTGILVTVKTE